MLKIRNLALVTSCIVGLSGAFSASVLAHEPVRSASAHVHGTGDAFINLSGNELFIQLSGPKANFALPGGEYDLSSQELEDFVTLPSSAKCTLEGVELELTGEFDVEEHHDHDDDDHEHGDDHAHNDDDHGDDHGDDHAHDDHDSHEGHADILLSLTADCAKPDKIKSITLSLFDTFEGFETVNVVFNTDSGAEAKTVSSASDKISRP